MDSKSVPLLAGLLVLVVIGVFLVGRGMMGTPGEVTTPASVPVATQAAEPEDLHPQLEAGRASIRAGQFEEAKGQLSQVPQDDVSYLLALNDLGIVHEELGETADARAAFEEILVHQPENPFALYGVCNAQIVQEDFAAAELSCLRVLEVDALHTRARFALGLIRVAQDKLVLGVDAYLRAVQQHNDEDRVREAAFDLDRFSETRPEMAGPHYAMAVLARVLVSRETEREELEKYLSLAPDGIAAENAKRKLEELTEMGY